MRFNHGQLWVNVQFKVIKHSHWVEKCLSFWAECILKLPLKMIKVIIKILFIRKYGQADRIMKHVAYKIILWSLCCISRSVRFTKHWMKIKFAFSLFIILQTLIWFVGDSRECFNRVTFIIKSTVWFVCVDACVYIVYMYLWFNWISVWFQWTVAGVHGASGPNVDARDDHRLVKSVHEIVIIQCHWMVAQHAADRMYKKHPTVYLVQVRK